MRYKLQNRYQDSGWEDLGMEFDIPKRAVKKALKCSKDAIAYGMVRVVDVKEKRVVVTFAAGGRKCE